MYPPILVASALSFALLLAIPSAAAGPATDAVDTAEQTVCRTPEGSIPHYPCTFLHGDPQFGQGRPCREAAPGGPTNINVILWNVTQLANGASGDRLCSSQFERARTIATGVEIIAGAV